MTNDPEKKNLKKCFSPYNWVQNSFGKLTQNGFRYAASTKGTHKPVAAIFKITKRTRVGELSSGCKNPVKSITQMMPQCSLRQTRKALLRKMGRENPSKLY